jgi:hypothetical protein
MGPYTVCLCIDLEGWNWHVAWEKALLALHCLMSPTWGFGDMRARLVYRYNYCAYLVLLERETNVTTLRILNCWSPRDSFKSTHSTNLGHFLVSLENNGELQVGVSQHDSSLWYSIEVCHRGQRLHVCARSTSHTYTCKLQHTHTA